MKERFSNQALFKSTGSSSQISTFHFHLLPRLDLLCLRYISTMPAKPKPNLPCPCGSGKKFKKCCNMTPTIAAGGGKAPFSRTNGTSSSSCSSFRFRIGDRVLANHNGYFRPGTVVALDYREYNWLGSVPYQIVLDDTKKLIYAPMDVDDCVRPMPSFGIGDMPMNEQKCTTKESRDRLVLKRRLRV